MVNVNWDDVHQFIDKLNKKTDNRFNYRLPSEAEWEYAARSAGQRDKWSGTNNRKQLKDYAHCGRRRFRAITARVGMKRANNLGLCDMSGNVWEWCQDVWHKDYNDAPLDGSAWMAEGDDELRVVRGGRMGMPLDGRTGFRLSREKIYRGDSLGFRLALGHM
jgi:formylglycine-generating enzyme required for sulfatase activity